MVSAAAVGVLRRGFWSQNSNLSEIGRKSPTFQRRTRDAPGLTAGHAADVDRSRTACDKAASPSGGRLTSALAALAAEHFDLALLDIGLPGADGLSLLRKLRGDGVNLPVMILTARDTLAAKLEALDLGADDFLMKPFEQAELAAHCRALIRRSNLSTSGQLDLGRMHTIFIPCRGPGKDSGRPRSESRMAPTLSGN